MCASLFGVLEDITRLNHASFTQAISHVQSALSAGLEHATTASQPRCITAPPRVFSTLFIYRPVTSEKQRSRLPIVIRTAQVCVE